MSLSVKLIKGLKRGGRMTKGDKITAAIIIFISLALFAVINLTQINSDRNYASIQMDGEEIEKEFIPTLEEI